MMAYYAITTFYVVVCLVLLLVILLQQGKGDMAAAFGGGSSSSAFGARGGATVLSKATAVLSALFMLTAMMLSMMGPRRFELGGERHARAARTQSADHRSGHARHDDQFGVERTHDRGRPTGPTGTQQPK